MGLLADQIPDSLQLTHHAAHLIAAAAGLDGKAGHGVVPIGREAQHQCQQAARLQRKPVVLCGTSRQRKIPPLTYNDPCVSHSSLHPNKR